MVAEVWFERFAGQGSEVADHRYDAARKPVGADVLRTRGVFADRSQSHGLLMDNFESKTGKVVQKVS
jgi:hypothetical protein